MGKLIDRDVLVDHLRRMMEARQIDRLPKSGYAKAIEDVAGCPTVEPEAVENLKAERDALMRDLKKASPCSCCANWHICDPNSDGKEQRFWASCGGSMKLKWKWQGVKMDGGEDDA